MPSPCPPPTTSPPRPISLNAARLPPLAVGTNKPNAAGFTGSLSSLREGPLAACPDPVGETGFPHSRLRLAWPSLPIPRSLRLDKRHDAAKGRLATGKAPGETANPEPLIEDIIDLP